MCCCGSLALGAVAGLTSLADGDTSTPGTQLRSCLNRVLRSAAAALWRSCQDFVTVQRVVLVALRPDGEAAECVAGFKPKVLVAAPCWTRLVHAGALCQTVQLPTKPFPLLSSPLIAFPWLFQSLCTHRLSLTLCCGVFWRPMAVARHISDVRNCLISPSREH